MLRDLQTVLLQYLSLNQLAQIQMIAPQSTLPSHTLYCRICFFDLDSDEMDAQYYDPSHESLLLRTHLQSKKNLLLGDALHPVSDCNKLLSHFYFQLSDKQTTLQIDLLMQAAHL